MANQITPESELKVKKNRGWFGTAAIIAAIFFSGAVIGWVVKNPLTNELTLVSQTPVGSVEGLPSTTFREDRDPVYAAALSSCTRKSEPRAISEEEAEDACRPGLDAIFQRVDDDHRAIGILEEIKQLFKN